VKPGTTLLTDGHASYPGLSGYRHDPRIVGAMAGHVVLPWSHRAFSLLKRWALAHIMAYVANTLTRISTNSCFAITVASIACFFRSAARARHHQEPTGCWDIIKRDNPRKRAGRSPRRAYYI